MVSWLTSQSPTPTIQDRFPGREKMFCSSMFHILNLLLKSNGGETEGLMLLFL